MVNLVAFRSVACGSRIAVIEQRVIRINVNDKFSPLVESAKCIFLIFSRTSISLLPSFTPFDHALSSVL